MRKYFFAPLLFCLFLTLNTPASATVISFDPLATEDMLKFGPYYNESGFQFTASHSFASWGSIKYSDYYIGSPAMFNNSGEGLTVLSQIGGESFSLNSIQIANIFKSADSNTVIFTGLLTGGGTASYTAELGRYIEIFELGFGTLFSDVTSVSWSWNCQFDNVTVNEENVPVPEPSTFILFGAGIAGAAFWRRRKASRCL